MSIWNKILIGFIFVASLAFFFFAARTMKTHAAWGKSYNDHQRAIDELKEKNSKLREEIHTSRMDLEKWMVGRPRIWSGCVPTIIQETGAVTVSVDSPSPHQIAPKAVLYVFDDAEPAQGGRYLGKFTVAQVADKQVVLQPAYIMLPDELARMKAAKRSWSLYENLPMDSNEAFAEWDEATKKANLPAASVQQYLDDALVEGEGGLKTWKRPLRDYRSLFDIYYRYRAELIKEIEAGKQDLKYATGALAGQEEQKKFFEGLVAAAKTELAAMQADLKIVSDHSNALAKQISEKIAEAQRLYQENQAAAARLTQAQLQATRLIEERTKRMAAVTGSSD